MSTQSFEMELEVGKVVHFDKDADESYGFGIYSCKPTGYTRELTYSKYGYGNISLQGTTRKLVAGERYEIKFEGVYSHAKHGSFYKLVSITPDKLDSIEDQDRFLLSIITPPQFKSLKEAYPNTLLVDLILEKKVDTKKTRGIKEKSLSTITAKVEKNMHISILLSKLNELELSTKILDKLMGHFGEVDVILDVIEKNIYRLCEVRGLGFKTIDGVALRRGDEPTNKNRITACFNHLLEADHQNGHTWSVRDRVVDDATELLYIDQTLIFDRLNELSRNDDLYCGDGRVASTRIRNQEKEIYRHLKRIRDTYITVSGVDEKIVERLSKVEKQQGFEFTEEQKFTISDSAKHGVAVINGGGGVGKTAIAKGLVDVLDEENYHSAALSGKASMVLLSRGIKSSTIHRMLGYDGRSFTYNEKSHLDYSTLILDEMSMIDTSLFLSVLRALPDGVKLLILGDSSQLSSIGVGNILQDLIDTKTFPTYELKQVHRQAAKSGVLELSQKIRFGEQPMPYGSSGKEVYGELQDQTLISYTDKNSIPSDIIKIAKSYQSNIKKPEDLYEFQVVVANRERGALSVRNINIELQKVFNDVSKPSLNRNGYDFLEGDKVISQGNQYGMSAYRSLSHYQSHQGLIQELGEDNAPEVEDLDVYNGTIGHIHTLLIDEKIVLVKFEGIDSLVALEQGDGMDKIDLAYAITVHKSQGAQFPLLLFAVDFGAYSLLSRQLIYTALSRAQKKGVALVEGKALHQAIENDISKTRRTFLADFMRGDSDSNVGI